MVVLATGRHLSCVASAAANSVRSQGSRQHNNRKTSTNISSTLGKIRQQQTTSFSSTATSRASHYQDAPRASATSSSAGPRYYDNPSPRSETSSTSSSSSSSSSNNSSSNYSYYSQAESNGGPTITEQSILGAFPRPNLSPTLHFSIFTGHFDGKSPSSKNNAKCANCAGPHSTDFCPC
ncbi:hypothetical protein BJV82DRAFT_667000 [Fennellomyces sp. T-0311]|nr:hypothetical protein BJV82DRAFT_667000 [Fennellomyces sp. T-0311]